MSRVPAPKNIVLLCGHSVSFRMTPMTHEELWCERCAEWRLQAMFAQAGGVTTTGACWRGHRWTHDNTHYDKYGQRRCKQCKNGTQRKKRARKKKTDA